MSDARDDEALEQLLGTIHERYHYDFRGYARPSMRRRLAEGARALGCCTIDELRARVEAHAAELGALLPFLTVQVTDLYRDPTFYRALRESVVPRLATYPWIRIWVAGCSSGEEAWSLAILMKEEGLLERTLIYATDIVPDALERAATGVYALNRIAGFSRAYRASGGRGSLSDHYTAAYGNAIFDRRLRASLVFADHSLTTDGVFAEVQLVTCRNVLIYFGTELRDRALGLFRDALPHGGFLGLGARESLVASAHGGAFEPLSREQRIYRRR